MLRNSWLRRATERLRACAHFPLMIRAPLSDHKRIVCAIRRFEFAQPSFVRKTDARDVAFTVCEGVP